MAINKFGRSIEDLLDLTDSDDSTSSSNSGVFDNQQPLILELHELKKDDPQTDTVVPPVAKAKKIKKKKKSHAKSHISMTSESQSEAGSMPPLTDTTEDEFYDAHESYHALPDNQVPKPVIATDLVLAHSEHGQDPKVSQEPPVSSSAQQTTAPPKAPSAITKPTARTE